MAIFIPQTSSFPIGFDLYNPEEEQVLYITDNVAGQQLTIEITNTSDKATTSKALAAPASDTNFHFELRFRPGTVFNAPAAVRVEGAQFELFFKKDAANKLIANSDGTQSLYFRAKTAFSLNPNERLTITISQIRAEAGEGTRGSRVMLNYANLLHAGSTAPFTGYREVQLNIVNHLGRKFIPMNMGFVGSNIVLNDGKATNILNLRVTNISRNGQVLNTAANSRLVLTVPGGDIAKEWTLATDAQLAAMKVLVTLPGQVAREVTRTAAVNEWILPFADLAPGQAIDIQMNTLVTNHKTGQSSVFVHFENIPGYWDGQLNGEIEKAPLVYSNKNAGIGTNTPGAKLSIVPDPNGRGVEVLSPTSGNTHFPWTDNWNYISGKGVVFRDGPMAEKFRMNAETGNMGIGESNPEARLVIKPVANGRGMEVISPTAGNTHFPWVNNWNYISGDGVIFRNARHEDKLRVDLNTGNVGIGDNNPEARLVIRPVANGRGMEVLSPTAGNTHFPWVNNWNYISGEGVVFRNSAMADKMRFDANSGNLDVTGRLLANGLSVGTATQFNQMQAGHKFCGGHGGGVKEVQINFPQGFAIKPLVICTVRGEGYYNDTFAVTVKYIDTNSFKVNLMRMDVHNGGWGQNLRLDWVAFSVNGLTGI